MTTVEGGADVATGFGDAGKADLGERMSGKRVRGREELAARVRQLADLQMELAQLCVMPRQRLGIVRAGRFGRHAHRAQRADEIAPQLARVRHSCVCGGGRLDRRHPVEGVEGGVVLAALDVCVADHAPHPRIVGTNRPAAFGFAKCVSKAVLRQVRRGQHASGVVTIGVARQHVEQHSLGFSGETRVARHACLP